MSWANIPIAPGGDWTQEEIDIALAECEVKTSKQSSSTVLFFLAGQTTIRQRETVTTTEYRGLVADITMGRVAVIDNTVQTTYHATFDGVDYHITTLADGANGGKVVCSAVRANEADGWNLIKQETSYSIEGLDTNTWKTTSQWLTSGGDGAVPISYEEASSYVFSYSGNTLFSTVATSVNEIRHIDTQEHAQTVVANNTSNGVTYKKLTCTVGTGSYFLYLMDGTEKRASARFISAEDGWTVVVTTTTHGYVSNPAGSWSVAT